MHTNQNHLSQTADPLSTWLTKAIQRSVAIEFETTTLFLRMSATGCKKNEPLLKKG